MKPVILHDEAQAELKDAVRFYRKENPGRAKRFAADVRAALARIKRNPETGSPDEWGFRRKYGYRFPYTLIYRIESERIHVLTVMHQRRDPDYWLHRL
ncbi:MAG TPA: type II toxin-antitoxin system RelE/ParE family toxin [Longimicrobium sp.]